MRSIKLIVKRSQREFDCRLMPARSIRAAVVPTAGGKADMKVIFIFLL